MKKDKQLQVAINGMIASAAVLFTSLLVIWLYNMFY